MQSPKRAFRTVRPVWLFSAPRSAAPPLDTPFRCRIALSASGWKVTALVLFPGLPRHLTNAARVAIRLPGCDSWSITLNPAGALPSVPVLLDLATLSRAGLADIDDGTPVCVDADLRSGAYTVVALT